MNRSSQLRLISHFLLPAVECDVTAPSGGTNTRVQESENTTVYHVLFILQVIRECVRIDPLIDCYVTLV